MFKIINQIFIHWVNVKIFLVSRAVFIVFVVVVVATAEVGAEVIFAAEADILPGVAAAAGAVMLIVEVVIISEVMAVYGVVAFAAVANTFTGVFLVEVDVSAIAVVSGYYVYSRNCWCQFRNICPRRLRWPCCLGCCPVAFLIFVHTADKFSEYE